MKIKLQNVLQNSAMVMVNAKLLIINLLVNAKMILHLKHCATGRKKILKKLKLLLKNP
jgi:hypothetical protein